MKNSSHTLSREAINLINQFQGGVPLIERPYLHVARILGLEESAVISIIGQLTSEGWLSRFGPIFDASRFGGAQTLAALEVPEQRFDEVSRLVNAFEKVAHNYRREHRLNMWCVLATELPSQIDKTLSEIEVATGLKVYNFPKQKEFYIGLRLYIDKDGSIDTAPALHAGSVPGYRAKELDRKLMIATQKGLPLHPTPFLFLAQQLGLEQETVLNRFETMQEHGVIRRLGAVPNHYRLGLRANGMTVWDVLDENIDEIGMAVGQLPFVSHCYLRCRHPGIWPYNLFAMVHGETRNQVQTKADLIDCMIGDRCNKSEVLYSSAVLKKTGLRLAA
jgi:DNA-binding Lrp family transcriptional regulator